MCPQQQCLPLNQKTYMQTQIRELRNFSIGYATAAVSSGEEAIDYLKQHSVDLLLLDMILGTGIDGLDTYKQIQTLYPEQ